jgi:DNA repair protein RadA
LGCSAVTDLEAVPGVGPAAAKKLREAYITTAELLSVQNPAELQERTKLGEGTVSKIIRNARDMTGRFGFRSGLEIEEEMRTTAKLTTGLSAFDDALFGGIEAGSIIEFYGSARGGKTQWCAHLAVRVQLPQELGGLEGRVLWLDTESSFKPWVIRANAVRWGLDPDATLGNIGRAQIVLSGQMEEIFETIPQLCAEQNYKLVVVDSLTGLFRAEYTGLDSLRIRQQDINKLLNQMRRTGTATNAVFAYTNQVMAKIAVYGGNPNAPVGGHIVSHASDYRFYVRKALKEKRKIDLQDNAGVPEFSKEFVLGWGGFYEDSKACKESEAKIKKYFDERGWGLKERDESNEEDTEESAEE